MSQSNHAYGLPSGSIRALLALTVFAGIWVLLVKYPTAPVPAYLQNLTFIIMGHYFAARTKPQEIGAPIEPNPLYLPKGSIRTLLVLGFVTVGVVLGLHNQLWVNGGLSQAALSLVLVLGFILGVLRSHIFRKPSRLMEDIRATISLSAGVVLILVVFGFLSIPHFDNAYNIHEEEILAACVGFYFGSKS